MNSHLRRIYNVGLNSFGQDKREHEKIKTRTHLDWQGESAKVRAAHSAGRSKQKLSRKPLLLVIEQELI